MRILLVEEDGALNDRVKKGLKKYGHTVDRLTDGKDTLSFIKTETFDVIVLELILSDSPGLSTLRKIREAGIMTPVLILTESQSIKDNIKILNNGADDYYSKSSFNADEFCARICALQRRSANHRAAHLVTYRNIELDPSSFNVTVKGQTISLSRREFSLLQKLLENVGHVVSRDLLTQCLYGWEDEIDSNALEVHIHNIRKKLGNTHFIQTIRGIGYRVVKENL